MKRRRANKKFEPTLQNSTIEKLSRFECGKPVLSQSSGCSTDDEQKPLQDKLIPVLEFVPEKSTRKDKLITSSKEAYPVFLTRFLEGKEFQIHPDEWQSLSPGQQRYWQLKKDCLDKILVY